MLSGSLWSLTNLKGYKRDKLTFQDAWFQAAVGPNTIKVRWVREGLAEIGKLLQPQEGLSLIHI